MTILTRRSLVTVGAGGLLLSGCDKLSYNPRMVSVLESAEGATERWQRLIGRDALAREFTEADISPVFRANGSQSVDTDDYLAHSESDFADWRLKVDGLVARPLSLSLAQLRGRFPSRITVIGVQPEVLDDLGGSLSECVRARLDEAVAFPDFRKGVAAATSTYHRHG